MSNGYERQISAYCKDCQTWLSEDETEFIDISEDFQGADILTFIRVYCKDCQTFKCYECLIKHVDEF